MGEGKVKVNSLDFYNVSALSTTISTLSHGQLPTFYRTLSIRASPAFTILLSIRLAYRRATQLTVYTVVPTNIPKLPKPPQAQHCLSASTLVQRHGLATQLLSSRSSRVFSPSHTTLTRPPRPRSLQPPRPPPTSAAAGPVLVQQEGHQLSLVSCLVSCLRCRAHLFLLRPPPRLPPPRPHGR